MLKLHATHHHHDLMVDSEMVCAKPIIRFDLLLLRLPLILLTPVQYFQPLLISVTSFESIQYIMNGKNAEHGQFPYIAAQMFKNWYPSGRKIRRSKPFIHHDCGATILSDRILLTAAHCVNKEHL